MIGTFAKDELEEACRTSQVYVRRDYMSGSDVHYFGAPTCYENIETAIALNPA